MSAGAAPTWPGSRVLLGWWRELAQQHPQQLFVSRLLFHRLEALVRVQRSHALDRWQQALLRLASTRLPSSGELLGSFADLQMDPQVLGQFVRQLTDFELVHRNGSGLWQMTAAGRQALTSGALSLPSEERRQFPFVDNSSVGRPPHFVTLERPLPPPPATSRAEVERYSFDLAWLQACIDQTPEWKRRYRFPLEVDALLLPQSDANATANRPRVVLDSLEQRILVLIRTPRSSAGAMVQGYLVQTEGWMREPEPLLWLSAGWENVLPDLTEEPPLPQWLQAWKAWAHPRSLPAAEVEACRLQRVDHRLLVHAPPRLIDRLRAARSDAVKQEAWLLAGDGRTRTAAQIELHSG
jgi:hypothetical protein